ncbi:hypothetical protein TNCT_84551 [Trichonephila clavata]|uniref:Uncharacterized protein n=1 Tax=Trichonephila clavata TaxID=2740835 RepID=A0A8X6KXN2_TRICU|nr:hypothetical protein TNCT_84551 [Trichonephila clavata]
MNNSVVITNPEEKIEISADISDNKSILDEVNEIDATKKDEKISDISTISIYESTNALSSGIDKTRSIKKFTPFTMDNISGPTEQTSAHSTEITHTLAKFSKYVFSDDKGDEFIIDNAEFEVEEKELIDIFNSNSEILPSNPFYERGSYNENYHFIPIPDSPDNPSDEDVEENYMLNNHNNPNLEILPSNPFYEMSSYNEGYQFTPISSITSTGSFTDEDIEENNMSNNPNRAKLKILPNNPFYERGSCSGSYHFIPNSVNTSPGNCPNENVQETTVDFSRKKNVFKKVKSFFKKLRNDNCSGFAYKRFK